MLRNQIFDNGVRALKNDNGQAALASWMPLAKFGDKEAQFQIVSIYAYGEAGVAPDFDRAVYWLRRCGESCASHGETGNTISHASQTFEMMIGRDLVYGVNGANLDVAEGIKWLRLAARDGSNDAKAILRQLQVRDYGDMA